MCRLYSSETNREERENFVKYPSVSFKIDTSHDHDGVVCMCVCVFERK